MKKHQSKTFVLTAVYKYNVMDLNIKLSQM